MSGPEVLVKGDDFLSSRWRGEGVVRGPFGRTLRSFSVTYGGVWSEEHEAFHVDERVEYADGRSLERKWAVSYDGLGVWSGGDHSAGQMTLRAREPGLVLRFNRSGAVKAFSVASLRLELTPDGPDVLRGRGVTRALGLPVAWTTVVYRRIDEDERAEAADEAPWSGTWPLRR